MARERVDEFLEAYRRLEAVAGRILPKDSKGGVISRLLRLPKLAPYREELDCCREVRNLLTHEVRVGGSPSVVPGEGMVPFLEKIIDLLENPPRLRQRMTKREQLFTVGEDSPVMAVMEEMRRRDLSRVPLLKGGVVRGMFSLDTVFRAVLDGVVIDGTTPMSALAAHLPLDACPITAYRFVPGEMTVEEAEGLYNSAYSRRSKIRALLVTATGSPNEPLEGIVTPYDLIG